MASTRPKMTGATLPRFSLVSVQHLRQARQPIEVLGDDQAVDVVNEHEAHRLELVRLDE